MIVFLYALSTNTACPFIVMSMAPEKKPVIRKLMRPIQILEEMGIKGMIQQNKSPEKMVSFPLLYRVVSQPVSGIATNAPMAVIKSIVPNTLLETPKKSFSSGSRPVQLAYTKPFTKK